MPTVTIRYTLPDEQAEYDAARLVASACGCLSDIDQRLRSLLKHGEPGAGERHLAEEIRAAQQVAKSDRFCVPKTIQRRHGPLDGMERLANPE